MALDDVDLTRLPEQGGLFPHEWFTRLRREAPVWYHPPVEGVPELAGKGFWVVSRHEDLRTVSQDWERFSSERTGVFVRDDFSGQLGVNMMLTDPPLQTRMRNLVNRAFTPRACRRLEENVRRRARALVERVAEQARCEFVYDVAAEIPVHVIADILGVPESERARLRDLVVAILTAELEPEEVGRVQAELFALAQPILEARRRRPEEDILSTLTHAEITDADGTHRLTQPQLEAFFIQLAFAGSETTWSALAGGLLALVEHREELDLLRREPRWMPSAVEEILRWTTPVAYFSRTATRDSELRGERIREGDKVTIWYPSANRDESVFEDPFRFDVRREPNPHVSFGAGGPHFCLGANLARMELRIVFEELLAGLDDIELEGPVERHQTAWDMAVFGSFKRMPIRVAGASA
ncbi:MAG: cytochrome P450 [Deltaproteobacteria bacterium]|jgi:cholest-4-en-3-one 26-monooxygenase|nr:cytochrome P450 [Deltaproteobacteria bacterium]MBW2497670.1 cytochrome P450 [Deltaproteobacteria bacterium]